MLRWFCRLYWADVPDESPLVRWANTLRPATLHQLNDRVVELARQARVTTGHKLQMSATCVQTTIHHPTDSGLLVDSVQVLSRFVKHAKGLVKDQVSHVQQACRSRLRTARRVAQTLHRHLRRKAEDKEAQQKELYQKLVEIAEHMVRQSQQVMAVLAQPCRCSGVGQRDAAGAGPGVPGVLGHLRKQATFQGWVCQIPQLSALWRARVGWQEDAHHNIFQDVLTLEYGEHVLSRYSVEWQPDDKHLLRVGNPRLYEHPYHSPQLSLWAPGSVEWFVIIRCDPPTRRRRKKGRVLLIQLPLWTMGDGTSS